MKTYYLVRFTYDKEYRKDTLFSYFKPTITRAFIEAKSFNGACLRLLKTHENARRFKNITKPRKIIKVVIIKKVKS